MTPKQHFRPTEHTPRLTWRELEAQGIKRCCAMFTDGTRCRKRVLAGAYDNWCGKHGRAIKRHTDQLLRCEEVQS